RSASIPHPRSPSRRPENQECMQLRSKRVHTLKEVTMARRMTRRQFNTALAAGMAVGGIGLPPPPGGSGPGVGGTWGSESQNLRQKHIAEPLLAPKGVEVIYDTANDTVRKTKLMAEKRLPRGSMDIVALTASGAYEMWKNGTLEELDASQIPNMKYVLPKLKT